MNYLSVGNDFLGVLRILTFILFWYVRNDKNPEILFSIFRIDDMGARIDDLEHNINDLMAQEKEMESYIYSIKQN